MDTPIYIFGHKNPDSDSICSAIGYAKLKNSLGYKNIKPYRLGKVSKETEFILNYFNIDAPELLNDTKPQVMDLKLYSPLKLYEHDTINKSLTVFNSNTDFSFCTVVNELDELKGIVSSNEIRNYISDIDEDLPDKYEIMFKNLVDVLNGTILCGSYKYEKLSGKIFAGSAIPSSHILTDTDIVITNDPSAVNLFSGCGCIILTDDETTDANDNDCCIMRVSNTLYKTILLINQCISLTSVMKKDNIITIYENEYAEDANTKISKSSYNEFPVLNSSNKVAGILRKSDINIQTKKKVILIDHNEKTQTIDGIENAQILEIVDHHRFAGLNTDEPLLIRAEPVGCSATIVYKMYKENNIEIEKPIAGILLSAILSDTLIFTSPTCTHADQNAGLELANIASIDIEQYGKKMLAAGTSLDGYSPKEILAIDRKKFDFGKYVMFISQVNTVNYKSLHDKKHDLTSEMEKFSLENNCDLVLLIVTDITLGSSELIAIGRQKTLIEQLFNMPKDENSIFIPGLVSRKKQVVPILSEYVKIQ